MASPQAAPAATGQSYLNADGSINWGNLVTGLGGSLASGVTGNNAAAAQITGTSNAVTQANTGNTAVQGIYQPQQALGNNAFTQLGSALGLPGSTPLSSNFLSQIPGFTQAAAQGQTAAQNMISAGGNLYNSGTPGLVGNYISSQIALPAYQNYVSNLLSTANLGAQANQGLSSAQLQTSGNIEQLNQNMGQENASGVQAVGSSIGNGLSSSGVSSLINSSGVSSGVSSLINSLFGSGGTSSTPSTLGNLIQQPDLSSTIPTIDLGSTMPTIDFGSSGDTSTTGDANLTDLGF